jgi:hypothetical protein
MGAGGWTQTLRGGGICLSVTGVYVTLGVVITHKHWGKNGSMTRKKAFFPGHESIFSLFFPFLGLHRFFDKSGAPTYSLIQ